MRILDAKTVPQPPVHHIHLELTNEELKGLQSDLASYILPTRVRFILDKMVKAV